MSDNSDHTYFDTVYFDIKEFLLEYEKLSCLWDKKHDSFKDRRERLKAEEILGEKLNIMDLKTLRRKIRSVRGTYNTEIRKIKMSLETDEGDVYVPKLSWFPLADKFLRVTTDLSPDVEFCYPDDVEYTTKKKMLQKLPRKDGVTVVMVRNPRRKSMENLDSKLLENNVDKIEKLDDEYDSEYEEIELDDQDTEDSVKTIQDKDSTIGDKNSEMYRCDSAELLQDERECSSSPEYNLTRKRRKTDTNEGLSDVVKYLKGVTCASESEFAVFGRSVGVQLQNMPLKLALQLQADIQAHISQTRLEYLKKSDS